MLHESPSNVSLVTKLVGRLPDFAHARAYLKLKRIGNIWESFHCGIEVFDEAEVTAAQPLPSYFLYVCHCKIYCTKF